MRRAPQWDPVVTVGLLVLGLIDTTRTVTIARDYPSVLQALFVQTGAGVYTRNDVAETVGWVVIAVNVIGLVLAIALSVPRLRDHRIAFFIPLAAGVVCIALTVVLTLGAALADPSFTAKLVRG